MVTLEQIRNLTDLVVAKTNAKKVYLFGSYAKNEAVAESDVDLLIIVEKDLSKKERRNLGVELGLSSANHDLFFPKDFKIYSDNEFNFLVKQKTSFLAQIFSYAKLIYG